MKIGAMWRFLLLPAFLAFPCVAKAQFSYTTEQGSATITGYTGSVLNLVIPGSLDGFPVVSIGNQAFTGKQLRSVSIPAGVRSIGQSAFQNCSRLTAINIPETVSNLEGGVFLGCSSLKSITIPSSVTNIGDVAFFESGLTDVTFHQGLKKIGWMAFSGCFTEGMVG